VTPLVEAGGEPVAEHASVRGPFRAEGVAVAPVWNEQRRDDVLYVKLKESAGVRIVAARGGVGPGRVTGTGASALSAVLGNADVRPVFPAVAAGEGYASVDLALWYRVASPDAVRIGARLATLGSVESVSFAPLPAPPPADLDPVTPDFRGDQDWLDVGDGLGMTEATRWAHGDGQGVVVGDVEYGWTEDHEDLGAAVGAAAWGLNTGEYAFHGTSVLGELFGGDNGFGVTGAVPAGTPRVLSPYAEDGEYDVAGAILWASTALSPGDVLLIEQQAYCPDGVSYCPIEVDDVVFDAIAAAVAAGIVVVEPGANGAEDLDDDQWDGRFDRTRRDSGAILVGGGCSPHSGLAPRSWFPSGSSYGSRVDVQGWYDSIVTTTNGDYDGYYADLYFPDGDGRQAYTSSFSGTSGASPMVAGVAAAAQAVALQRWHRPWDPLELRAALVSTGTPQPDTDTHHIGPLPDLRRLLRSYLR